MQVVESWFPQSVNCVGFKKEKISELSNSNILDSDFFFFYTGSMVAAFT